MTFHASITQSNIKMIYGNAAITLLDIMIYFNNDHCNKNVVWCVHFRECHTGQCLPQLAMQQGKKLHGKLQEKIAWLSEPFKWSLLESGHGYYCRADITNKNPSLTRTSQTLPSLKKEHVCSNITLDLSHCKTCTFLWNSQISLYNCWQFV